MMIERNILCRAAYETEKSDAMSAFAKIGHDNDAGECPLLG